MIATYPLLAPHNIMIFLKFKMELLKDHTVKREYDCLKPKYDLIQRLIENEIPFDLDKDGFPIDTNKH